MLKTLNTGNNISLYLLACESNDLTILDVSKNTALSELYCSWNSLTALDLSKNTALKSLYCGNNRLQTLDVSKNAKLRRLSCCVNKFYTLDLSNNPNLRMLECNNTYFTAFDISKNTALMELYCQYAAIRNLDLSKNTALVSLDCSFNDLTTLDLSSNSALKYIKSDENSYMDLLDITYSESSEYPCKVDLKSYVGSSNISKISSVTAYDKDNHILVSNFNSTSGVLNVASKKLVYIKYKYNSGYSGSALGSNQIEFTLSIPRYKFVYIPKPESRFSLIIEAAKRGSSSSGKTTSVDEKPYVSYVIKEVSYDYVPKYAVKYDNEESSVENISSGIEVSRIEPVELGSYVIENVAEIMGINSNEIKFLSDENIGSKQEANQAIIDNAAKENHDIVEMLNSLTVSESGYYVFKVVLSDAVFWQFFEQSADHVQLYSFSNTETRNDNCEIMSLSGEQLQLIDTKEILGVCNLTSNITSDFYLAGMLNSNAEILESSGAGCNYGANILCCVFMILGAGLMKVSARKKLVLLALIFIAICTNISDALERVKVSDYILPISYDVYTISGTYTTNFDFNRELINGVIKASERHYGYTPRNVLPYDGKILSPTWQPTTEIFYDLARSGLYGAVLLPVKAAPTVSSDYKNHDLYVALCTFNDDVKPGELIKAITFDVNDSTTTATGEAPKTQNDFSLALDEKFNYVDKVPENRKVYIALASDLSSEMIGGMVTVVRGKYVEEEDPLNRLDPEVAKSIADSMSISVEGLKYLSRGSLYSPLEPTNAIKNYVKNDNHEIIAKLPTISVDRSGWYVFSVTLSDDIWKEVQSKDLDDFKFYALRDDGVNIEDLNLKPLDDSARVSIINGLVNAYEIFTLKGDKLKKFDTKTFLIAGLLRAGTPFSFYLGKLLINVLSGSCNASFIPVAFILGLGIIIGRRK